MTRANTHIRTSLRLRSDPAEQELRARRRDHAHCDHRDADDPAAARNAAHLRTGPQR